MKKRILSTFLAMALSITGIIVMPQCVRAEEQQISPNESFDWNFNQKSISLDNAQSTRFTSGYNNFSADTPNIVSFWDNTGNYNVVSKYSEEEEVDNGVIIQKYNAAFELVDTIKIQNSLSGFGNIICDGDYYYILWGESDLDLQNVVTNLSKYSLDGTKLAECKLTGYESGGSIFGTTAPFMSGTANMAIQNGVLACIYVRQMYNGHQSNYCFYVDTDTMKRLNTDTAVYCSHSFDQAVTATSDGGFLFVNHGDGAERAFMVDYVEANRGKNFTCNSFHFREGANRYYGYNETYAQFGGIAETDNGYVFCGSSEKTLSYDVAPTNGNYYGHGEARNLFVQVLKKDYYKYTGADQYVLKGEVREATGTKPTDSITPLFLRDGVKDYGVIWLTDYPDSYYANNPKVVVTDDNRIIIFWEKLSYVTNTGSTYFAIWDQNMNVVQPETEIPNVYLPGNTDLKYKDGKVYWVTNDDYGQLINVLDVHYKVPDVEKESVNCTPCQGHFELV